MNRIPATPAGLLTAELRRDGTRPLLTYYDDATGERVELSVITFDNWVSKTAGMLTDGFGVEPGDRVALLLPPHWQTLVWAAACWTVGARVTIQFTDDAQVVVVGPDDLDIAARHPEVVAMALHPMAGRFPGPLPPGVRDYAAEVPSYPDRFVPITPPAPDEPALDHIGVSHTLTGLIDRAHTRVDQLDVAANARLLVTTDDVVTTLVDALLVPLVVGGSAVLVRHENAAARGSRVDTERITAIAS